jgi:AbrB family looped-hinge helix DNA binding protein
MAVIKTSSKGQILIPKEMRRKLGLKGGQKVSLKIIGDQKIELTPIPIEPVEAFCGIFQEGSSLTEALLKERKQELTREESKIA